ncbi:hypothetical protein PBPRA1308 [Photobacterium profundum SS9]|uniref:Uncharacterized protein n=2 Tax=Photobacterium profundum TaxID=74109 RepID=Q6LSK7_PHOPR|nr:hypothetical protein PBPRA1308 [Photobacterium profundum SS9]
MSVKRWQETLNVHFSIYEIWPQTMYSQVLLWLLKLSSHVVTQKRCYVPISLVSINLEELVMSTLDKQQAADLADVLNCKAPMIIDVAIFLGLQQIKELASRDPKLANELIHMIAIKAK